MTRAPPVGGNYGRLRESRRKSFYEKTCEIVANMGNMGLFIVTNANSFGPFCSHHMCSCVIVFAVSVVVLYLFSFASALKCNNFILALSDR